MNKQQEQEVVQEDTTPESSDTELTESLKRVQADFENYRKQVDKRIEDIRKTASKHLLFNLLPVVDHLELALKHTQDPDEFKKGVEMIHSQLMSALEQEGLKPIEASGEFDIQKHEAIEKVASSDPENMVLQEVQKGYMLGEKVLRPAKVKVSAGKDHDNTTKREAKQ